MSTDRTPVIGRVTRYVGHEHEPLHNLTVRVVAVLRGALEHSDYDRVTTDAELARLGGLTRRDRVEVHPWIEQASRYSFVSYDPRAEDLEAFAYLRDAGRGPEPGGRG
ncbi:MAG: hypothetical protein AB7O52_13745 [Planctomycetota bacterium]